MSFFLVTLSSQFLLGKNAGVRRLYSKVSGACVHACACVCAHVCVRVCVCVCAHAHACSVAQLYLTLCDPVGCSPPGYSVHGISQASILEWGTISSSRESS